MNFRSSHKRAHAASALNDSFTLERSQRVPRSHEADVVKSGEFPFRRHKISRFQFPVFDNAPYLSLDPSISRDSITRLRYHLDFLDSAMNYVTTAKFAKKLRRARTKKVLLGIRL